MVLSATPAATSAEIGTGQRTEPLPASQPLRIEKKSKKSQSLSTLRWANRKKKLEKKYEGGD